jgi:predicted metal-dependent HD superfamily phosphohydrolase
MSSRPLSASELEARWRALSARVGLGNAEQLFEQLDLERVAYSLSHADELEHRARHPENVELALWLAGAEHLPPGIRADVQRLLRVLETHEPDGEDADGQVLSDADLAILSAPAREYRRYAAQLCPDQPALRLRQINALLARDSIYRTPEMRAGREARAQLNLARERAALTATTVNSAKPDGAPDPLA